jgi:hypothetical protein
MSDPFEGIDKVEPVEAKPKGKKSKKKAKPQVLDDFVDIKPVDKQSDDVKEKATLIYAVKSYHRSARFKKYLKSQGKSCSEAKLNKMTVDNLKLELESLDLTIADRGNSDFIDSIIKNGLQFSENIVNDRTKMKIKGTTAELFENDKFLDLVERVKLKYGLPSVKLDPGIELLFLALTTAMAVHQSNAFRNDLVDDSINLDEPVAKME